MTFTEIRKENYAIAVAVRGIIYDHIAIGEWMDPARCTEDMSSNVATFFLNGLETKEEYYLKYVN